MDDFPRLPILSKLIGCYHEVHKSLGKRIRQLRAPSLLDGSGFVPLLLLPAPRHAGRACSALCIVLVLVALRFGLWTMMAELCFSVDDFIVLFSSNFSKTAAETASEYHSCGHRRCWTAAAWCPYYCRRRAKPVGLVLPCVYCSRTRCCALWFVDDDGRALYFGR